MSTWCLTNLFRVSRWGHEEDVFQRECVLNLGCCGSRSHSQVTRPTCGQSRSLWTGNGSSADRADREDGVKRSSSSGTPRLEQRCATLSAVASSSSVLLSSLEMSDTTIYEPYIRALLGTSSPFCEAVECCSGCAVMGVVWRRLPQIYFGGAFILECICFW